MEVESSHLPRELQHVQASHVPLRYVDVIEKPEGNCRLKKTHRGLLYVYDDDWQRRSNGWHCIASAVIAHRKVSQSHGCKIQ